MKLTGRLSISRIQGNTDGFIEIQLEDKLSSQRFLEVKVPFDLFAQILTGASSREVELEVEGLDRIGKKMLMDNMDFVMPEHTYENRKQVAYEEAKRICPEGWEPDSYFGSKKSFYQRDKQDWVQCIIRKWVAA